MHDHAPAEKTYTVRNEAGASPPSVTAVRSLAREVVLRLSRSSTGRKMPSTADLEAEEVVTVCAALTSPDPDLAEDIARAALDGGLSFDDLCETRLAPAARRLGTLWERDELSFAEVTLAANRLFGILRTLAHRPIPRSDARFAVFASVPGEEHILGVTMAAERARGAGWDVALCLGMTHGTLVERITEAAPDVIGLSLSSQRTLLSLTRLVVALRIAVPASPIVVCGPGAAELNEPIIGTDVITPDFDQAMAAMRRLTA